MITLVEAIEKLPKTDLHCHLDGSMRVDTILEIARKEKIDIGTTDQKKLEEILLIGKKAPTLPHFLKGFEITCAVMQSKEAIERIAFELAEDAAKENVRYLEARFAPIFMIQNGLTSKEVVLAARKGFAKAEKKFPIRVGIIICAIRILDPKVSVELANLAVELKKDGVVGFDLAHAENGNPAGKHAEAFRIAKEGGLGLTVHAGEDYGPESIEEAIESCFAQRIGHGRTLCEDPELEERVRQRQITVEACPSSNVQISLTPRFEDHPLKSYVKKGVNVTLNTDNRLLTGINVTDEYVRSAKYLKLTWDELKTVALNGFRSSFLPQSEKDRLILTAENEIKKIDAMMQ